MRSNVTWVTFSRFAKVTQVKNQRRLTQKKDRHTYARPNTCRKAHTHTARGACQMMGLCGVCVWFPACIGVCIRMPLCLSVSLRGYWLNAYIYIHYLCAFSIHVRTHTHEHIICLCIILAYVRRSAHSFARTRRDRQNDWHTRTNNTHTHTHTHTHSRK